MARQRLFEWLRHLFLVSPTVGLNGIQSLILVSSLGYLGYVWHAEQSCPLFLSNRRRRAQQEQLSASAQAVTRDPLEAELVKELGKTTFKEWQARGFIPPPTYSSSSTSTVLEREQQHVTNAASSAELHKQQQAPEEQQQPRKAASESAKSTISGSDSV